MSELKAAIKLWKKLGLAPEFTPVKRFGTPSTYGKIFLTKGNKLMKVMAWSKNAEREMQIAKIAGNANIGPKVYNTRTWNPTFVAAKSINASILSNLAPARLTNRIVVITMDKVPRAKSLYNAINNGTVKNFSKVENIVRRMHAAGIHHGNLHGDNILVYVNNSGNLKFVPINFGASKHNTRITNTSSAVRYAIKNPGSSGTVTRVNTMHEPEYYRSNRSQPVKSNENMIKHLKEYFNLKTKKP